MGKPIEPPLGMSTRLMNANDPMGITAWRRRACPLAGRYELAAEWVGRDVMHGSNSVSSGEGTCPARLYKTDIPGKC